MFIFDARYFHSRCIWYEKRAPENGVDLRRQFLEHVSWVYTCLCREMEEL